MRKSFLLIAILVGIFAAGCGGARDRGRNQDYDRPKAAETKPTESNPQSKPAGAKSTETKPAEKKPTEKK